MLKKIDFLFHQSQTFFFPSTFDWSSHNIVTNSHVCTISEKERKPTHFIQTPQSTQDDLNTRWWMETNKKGNRILVVNGHRFYKYGSGNREKYHWYCRSYQTLG